MIFNTLQRNIETMLKIMGKNWNIIVIPIQHLIAVKKHLTRNEKYC